jgi:hypothetical protein
VEILLRDALYILRADFSDETWILIGVIQTELEVLDLSEKGSDPLVGVKS